MFEEDTTNLPVDSILRRPKNVAHSFPKFRPHSTNHSQEDKLVQSQGATKTNFHPPDVVGRRDLKYQPGSRQFFLKKKFWVTVFVLLVLAGLTFFGIKFINLGQKIFNGKSPLSFFSSFGQLFTAGDKPLKGEVEGQINILLMGIGGEGHNGALLTDTMIVASIKPAKDGQPAALSLFSIPRDFIVKLPEGLDYRKINSAYAYGELRQENLGAKWAQQAVEEVTGTSVPYYALIDFAGFKQAIDDLGGVDVFVERNFSDSSYPDYREGYLPTIRFEQGLQHMDGERALQFTRSRHGTNNEGSDFARSRRQQKILGAVKEKVLKLKLSTNLSTINKLLNNFANHFHTNFEPWEIKRVYDLTKEIKSDSFIATSLDPTTGLVCNSIDENTGAYILTYCAGKKKADVWEFFANILQNSALSQEISRIEFQNSTKVNFLAQRAKDAFSKNNFQITISNYPGQERLDTSVIYDLSAGAKPKTAAYLKENLRAELLTNYPYLDKIANPKPDFIIVLGTDVNTSLPAYIPPPPAPKTNTTTTSTLPAIKTASSTSSLKK